METKYTVSNTFGIAGTSAHNTPEAALRAANKREGGGWIVTDTDGNRYDWNAGKAYICG